jgi:hypothetical protein
MATPARRRRPAPPRLAPLHWERKGFLCPPDLCVGIERMSKTFSSEGDFLRYLVRQEWKAFQRNTPPTTP